MFKGRTDFFNDRLIIDDFIEEGDFDYEFSSPLLQGAGIPA